MVKRMGKLNGLEARLENANKKALALSAQLVEQRTRQKAPVDTGRLKRSYTFVIRVLGKLVSKALVGTNVEYSGFVEKGTKFMQAQPHLRPALKESINDIKRIFADAIRAAFK